MLEVAILSSFLYSAEPITIQQQTEQLPAVYVRSVNDILMLKGLTSICDDAEEVLKGNVVLFLYDKSEKSKSLAEVLAKVIEEHAESRKVNLLIAGEDCMAYGYLSKKYKLHVPSITMIKSGNITFQTPDWWWAAFDRHIIGDRARNIGRSIKPYLLDLQN